MTLQDYIIKEAVEQYGVEPTVVGRLCHFGCRPLAKWATQSEIWRKVREVGTHVVWKHEYQRIADSVDEERVTWKYLAENVAQSRVLQLSSLMKRREYKFIREILEENYPFPLFWNSVLPYAWISAKKLAAVHLIARGWHVFDISDRTGLSDRTIYLLKQWVYDTKPNTEAVSQV